MTNDIVNTSTDLIKTSVVTSSPPVQIVEEEISAADVDVKATQSTKPIVLEEDSNSDNNSGVLVEAPEISENNAEPAKKVQAEEIQQNDEDGVIELSSDDDSDGGKDWSNWK